MPSATVDEMREAPEATARRHIRAILHFAVDGMRADQVPQSIRDAAAFVGASIGPLSNGEAFVTFADGSRSDDVEPGASVPYAAGEHQGQIAERARIVGKLRDHDRGYISNEHFDLANEIEREPWDEDARGLRRDLASAIRDVDAIVCDGRAQGGSCCATYACMCSRCEREEPAERFHTCEHHVVEASEKHERVRGRGAVWAAR